MGSLPTQEEKIMKTTVTMPCHLGLHARTAVNFINFAQEFCSTIKIRKGKYVADGKSILGLLTLGAAFNSKLEVEVVGDDSARAIKEIEYYFLDQSHCADDI